MSIDDEPDAINHSYWTYGDGVILNATDIHPLTIVDLLRTRLANLSRPAILLVVVQLLFSLVTIFGNLLVILAVLRERYLHSATNYFVMSLALADCLVGLVVMPFSTLYEVTERSWIFGINWCDIWRSLDVLFSTASILNLCVISLDRYWAITDPFTYPTKMSRRRAFWLIGIVWLCSGVISFPAILWWRHVRTEIPLYQCPFTDNLEYLIFSSTISFYLPLVVMVFTYYRIYRAAVFQTRSLKSGSKQVAAAGGDAAGLTLRIHRGGAERYQAPQAAFAAAAIAQCPAALHLNRSTTQLNNASSFNSYNGGASGCAASGCSAGTAGCSGATACVAGVSGLSRQPSANSANRIAHSKSLHKNFSLSRKLSKFAKEKKAAKTLGIVMGVFIICWLPFFILNLLSGICSDCVWNGELTSSIATWLGWMNSGMNPFIYAAWSKDFRR